MRNTEAQRIPGVTILSIQRLETLSPDSNVIPTRSLEAASGVPSGSPIYLQGEDFVRNSEASRGEAGKFRR